MDQVFPKKNLEAAKKLLKTPDEKLTNIERDKKFLLAIATMPMPCPMSVVDATDDTLEIGGGNYIGEYICLPELRDRAREGRAVLYEPGHAGLALAEEAPHPRQEEGQRQARLLPAGSRSLGRRTRRHLMAPRQSSGPPIKPWRHFR